MRRQPRLQATGPPRPRARFLREHGDLHASTVKMIEAINPEWTEQSGLCQRCWRFYVGLGRVVDYLRGADASPEVKKASRAGR